MSHLKDVFYTASHSELEDFLDSPYRMYAYKRRTPIGAKSFFSYFTEPLDILNHPIDIAHCRTQIHTIFVHTLEEKIRQHPFYESWLSDVEKNCQLIANVIHTDTIALSLDSTSNAKHFHRDGLIIDARLICTYKGPGTLWLPDAYTDRAAYESGAPNSIIVKDASKIQQFAPWDVGVFRGGIGGITHRSPDMTCFNEKGEINRVFLRLNRPFPKR